MRIIEIQALENGAHRNQIGAFDTIPPGWLVIAEEVEIPDSFPFVELEISGDRVTGMSALPVPDEPEDEEETFEDLTLEMLIDHDFRLTLLEEFGVNEEEL